MDIDKEYYEWEILNTSTFQSTRLPIGDKLAIGYIGMTTPATQDSKSYKLRITIRHVFPFTNGVISVNSIIHLLLKTTIPVKWTAQDENSVEALTIALKEIDKGIRGYLKTVKDISEKNISSLTTQYEKTARELLNTRFELEN